MRFNLFSYILYFRDFTCDSYNLVVSDSDLVIYTDYFKLKINNDLCNGFSHGKYN